MNDATQKMLVTVGAGIAQKILMGQAIALVSHGVMSANYTEVYVSCGMALVGAGWSLWQDFGKPILLSQIEVLKAKSLAQAQQAKLAGLPQVTVNDIAAQSRTMTPADVVKAVAKLPPENQASVAPVKAVMTMALAAIAFAALLAVGSGHAEAAAAATKQTAPATTAAPSKCAFIIDPLKLCGVLTGNIQTDVQRVATRLAAVSKADLNYAMAKAKAAGNPASKVRLQCVQAISDAADQVNGVSLKNPDGTAMVRPDPALVTMIEDVAELVDNLSPQGTLLTSCAGAAQMLGMNALQAVNAIITGTAAFVALPVGL